MTEEMPSNSFVPDNNGNVQNQASQPLAQPVVPQPMGTVANEEKQKSPIKKILMIVGIVFGVLITIGLIAIGISTYASSKVRRVSKEFIVAVKNGDMEEAYKMTSSDFKEATSEKDFETFVTAYKSLPLDEVKTTSYNVETKDGSSEAEINYTLDDGQLSYTVTSNLVKESGEWKIYSFQINSN